MLDRLLDSVRRGENRVSVVRGDAGVGKTALLEYAVERASTCRVVRAAGVQSEMELPIAGLQQLFAPMMDHLERLPVPQRDAPRTAFGLSAGEPPDRFLVSLAALSLLAAVAEERPLVCIVDDAQRLRSRLGAGTGVRGPPPAGGTIAVVFAARTPSEEQELLDLIVGGLRDGDARALLDSAIRAPLDERVCDRIVAETRGNPLALLDLPRHRIWASVESVCRARTVVVKIGAQGR